MSGGSKPKDPKPTAEEKALAWRAANDWNDYVTRYVPLEDKAIEWSTPKQGDIDRLQGEASLLAAKGLGEQYQIRAEAGTRGGAFGAASGMGLGDVARAQASAGGIGAAQAERAVKDRELATKTKLTAFGRGLADQSRLGLASSAQDATRLALEKYQTKQEKSLQQQQLFGELAGVAAGAGLSKLDGYLEKHKLGRYKE